MNAEDHRKRHQEIQRGFEEVWRDFSDDYLKRQGGIPSTLHISIEEVMRWSYRQIMEAEAGQHPVPREYIEMATPGLFGIVGAELMVNLSTDGQKALIELARRQEVHPDHAWVDRDYAERRAWLRRECERKARAES